jgi:hypothetical protein
MSADHFRCEGPPRRSYPVLRHRYNPLVDSPEQDGLPEAMVSTRRLAAIVAPMSRDLRAPPYQLLWTSRRIGETRCLFADGGLCVP